MGKQTTYAVPTYTGPSLLEWNEEENEVEVSPYVYQVEVFKEIVRRDRGGNDPKDSNGRYKKHAKRELAYIHLMYSSKSPYVHSQSDENQRHKNIKKDLGLPSNWRVDKDLQAAIDKYRELTEDYMVKLWKSALTGLNKIRDYIDKADFDAVDANGRLIWDMKTYQDTFKNIDIFADKADKIEKKIHERQSEETVNYGGVEDTEFNE